MITQEKQYGCGSVLSAGSGIHRRLEMYPPQIRGDYCDPVLRCSLLSKGRSVCVTFLQRINYWFLRNLRVRHAFLGFAWMALRRLALLTALRSSASQSLLQSHLELHESRECQLFLSRRALSFRSYALHPTLLPRSSSEMLSSPSVK